MTESLYRKEALEARGRSLFGQVILHSPPSRWAIIFLICAVLLLIFIGLTTLTVGPDKTPMAEWIISQFSKSGS